MALSEPYATVLAVVVLAWVGTFAVLVVPSWLILRKTGLGREYVFLILIPVFGLTVFLYKLSRAPWPKCGA
jgi:hypothetical protein